MSNSLKYHSSKGSLSFSFILKASMAAFITYMSMYAFRKPFTASTYDGMKLWGFDYKILLILSQMIGYTLSKYLGIKFVSELNEGNRVKVLIFLMGFAWFSLLLFAVVPYPHNLPLMFFNGLPLGMIWGVVFSFLEGRRSTELLGAVMASSFIVSSGIVKTVGAILLSDFNVSDFWMPFLVSFIFMPLLALGIYMLTKLEKPDEHDKTMRTERIPMGKLERQQFFLRFAPGIILSVIIYVALTVFRDLRDNFAIEFWTSLGYVNTPQLMTFSELPIAIFVLVVISLMIRIVDNKVAFMSAQLIIFVSGTLLILFTWFFVHEWINALQWMILSGACMYMPYIAYHTMYFERWIAFFRCKGNAGFLMYLADAAGYLGSTIVLCFRNFAAPNLSWWHFFTGSALIIGMLMVLTSVASNIYFHRMSLDTMKTVNIKNI
jgi:hypothetical protein